MNKIALSLLFVPGILFFSSQGQTASQVTVHYPDNQATALVSDAERLSELLASPALANRSWWPGTVIAEKQASIAAEKHYQQVMSDLRQWAQDEDGTQRSAIEQVIKQLASIRVTGRQFTSLDPDQVRLHPQNDRRLKGEYSVWTLYPPSTVMLAGAINGAGKVDWQPGKTVKEYLDDQQRLPGAERNVAMVIAPDGSVTEAPVAYWNQRHREVTPGSTIYLGFSDYVLPNNLQELNQHIVSVLTHRIPD